MKKAFTLIELIFVIVLIGVLSGIAFYMNRPDPTKADAQYTLLKLKEARYRAIGFQGPSDSAIEEGCVILNASDLSNNKNNKSPTHDIKSVLALTLVTTNQNSIPHKLDFDRNETCFDALGRPHDGHSTALNTLLKSDLNITFTKGTNNKSIIRLFPQSGYATITCNN